MAYDPFQQDQEEDEQQASASSPSQIPTISPPRAADLYGSGGESGGKIPLGDDIYSPEGGLQTLGGGGEQQQMPWNTPGTGRDWSGGHMGPGDSADPGMFAAGGLPGPSNTTVMPPGWPGGGGFDPDGPPGPHGPTGPTPGGGDGDGITPGMFNPFDFNFGPSPEANVPGMGPLTGQLGGFGQNMLENPSRFDIGLVQDIGRAIDHELGRAREQSMNTIDERMASRGLVGSNVEAETSRRALEDIEQDRLQRMNALNMELARTAAGDRATAGQLGMGINQQTFGQGMARSQFDYQSRLQSRAQELQAQGMEADEAYRRAQMDLEQQLTREQFDVQKMLASNDQRIRAIGMILQAMGASGLGEEFFDQLPGGSAPGPDTPQEPPGDPRSPDPEPPEEEDEPDNPWGAPPPGDPRGY